MTERTRIPSLAGYEKWRRGEGVGEGGLEDVHKVLDDVVPNQ